MPGGLAADDRLQIAALFSWWARYEDAGHADAWAELFTQDGGSTNSAGRRVTGRTMLRRASEERRQTPEARRSAHWFAGPVISSSENSTDAMHYGVLVERLSGDFHLRDVSMRTYRLSREGAAWKIYDRRICRLHPTDKSMAWRPRELANDSGHQERENNRLSTGNETSRLTATDRLDIQQLLSDYSYYEDSGDAEAWSALFCADGRFQGRNKPPVIGREALCAFARKRWETKPEVHRRAHFVSNIVIRETQAGASVQSYQMTVDKAADGYRISDVTGKDDEVRREDGRWRFFSRTVVPVIAE